ncbi:hypothetical protein GCM10020331_072750 [Ectobacillus funiculus]
MPKKKAKTIHIDIDPAQIGKRYPVDVGLAGEAGKKTLEWLSQHVSRNDNRTFLERSQERMQKVVGSSKPSRG